MHGSIRFEPLGSVARVTLSNQPKFNAMSRAMWRQLRTVFQEIQCDTQLRCVVVAGENGNFCTGGDISEYPDFRFEVASLRDFHEHDVWGGLQAMLDCDLPIVAQIDGHCMGAGIEIASCCDIRLSGASARFGAPIARLGFPMAPREAALVLREVGLTAVRQMLLQARIFSASEMQGAGFLSRVVAPEQLLIEVNATVLQITALAPQAARLHKRTLRALLSAPARVDHRGLDAAQSAASAGDNAYAYADSAEHHEGIQAFLQKRKPAF